MILTSPSICFVEAQVDVVNNKWCYRRQQLTWIELNQQMPQGTLSTNTIIPWGPAVQ